MCRLSLRGAHIEHGIDARHAVLVSDIKRDNYVKYAKRARYALDLPEAKIGGDVRLFPAFAAYGGVNINGEIVADLIKVRGDLSLNAFNGVVRGQAAIIPFDCSQNIELRGAQIGGNIDLTGAVLAGRLNMSTSRIEGNANFCPHRRPGSSEHTRFVAQQLITMDESHIGGNLNMEGAFLNEGFHARGITINGYCKMGHHAHFENYIFESRATIEMDDASVGFDLDMSGAYLHGEFLAPNLHVGGKLCLCVPVPVRDRAEAKHRFIAKGRINLSGAVISSDFDLAGATLERGLRFRGGHVKSTLIIDVDGGQLHNIGSAKNPEMVMSSIDLLNSHANIVSDFLGGKLLYSESFTLNIEGFTYGRFRGPEDIESLTKKESERQKGRFSNEKASKRPWRKWLELQYEKVGNQRKPQVDTYSPAPYNTLIATMHRDGFTAEADQILVEKLDIERRFRGLVLRFALKPYGIIFRYGLAPLRGSVWYAAYIALVWGIIAVANYGLTGITADSRVGRLLVDSTQMDVFKHYTAIMSIEPVMIVRPQPQTASLQLSAQQPADYRRVTNDFVEAKALSMKVSPSDPVRLSVIPCRQRISTLLYALDMIIPVIDLGQKNRCDFSETRGLPWMILKAVLTIIGWIFTSLVVLTWSGIIRRRIEPSA
ncbi:MAG TPA: hypothetical protein VLZ84_02615 [Asticcacaulis sp.]|nr:hypothetical protein [Asticcacaulis sp.]